MGRIQNLTLLPCENDIHAGCNSFHPCASAKFSLGIYDEWGSGKTTLMKVIEKKLLLTFDLMLADIKKEDQFAIVGIVKTIAFAMGEHRI